MLRCCLSLLCSPASVEQVFRRVLGTQSILLDLVPVKKPLIDGSLSWFVEESIEIVLVSGVKGTSPGEVIESVKQRAVHLLQKCGDGDAQKGCLAVKSRIEEATALRHLLRRLDLQVRLKFSSKPYKTSQGKKEENTKGVAVPESALQADVALHCCVYEMDAWEPRLQAKHLSDLTSAPAESLDQVLCEALQVVRRNAEEKGRQLSISLHHEASLLLSSKSEIHSTEATSTEPGPFVTMTYRGDNDVTADASATKSAVQILMEDPTMRWMVSKTSYVADFKFLKSRGIGTRENGIIAGFWELFDEVGNSERSGLPLLMLKDKKGLVYQGDFHEARRRRLEETVVEKLDDDAVDDAEVLCVESVVNSEGHTSNILRQLLAQPLFHLFLHRASCENLCGSLMLTCAEDFIGSSGRLEVDAWLSEQGRPTTIPMLPRYLLHFNPMDFLRECLPLELGSRRMVMASVGCFSFGYHVAAAPGGRVVTPKSSFNSALSAVSILLPWHTAMPLRPSALEQKPQQQDQQQQQKSSVEAQVPLNSPILAATDPDVSGSYSVSLVRVIDVEASLRKLGVVQGSLKTDTLYYYDAEGRTIFSFGQMDTLRGIARFVKRVRQSPAACFTSLSVVDNLRAPLLVTYRAFGGTTPNKTLPFIKRLRLPVPLVPGEFFSFRFAGLCEMQQRENALLQIFEEHSEDPANWPLRPRSPCFLNRWRLTRGIIAAIARHDPLFSYTLERIPVADGDEVGASFFLRFFSGSEVTKEIRLHETSFLSRVKDCLVNYAAQWSLNFPPMEDIAFALLDVKKSKSVSYKAFISSFLQSSEIFVERGNILFLELQISPNLKIALASGEFVNHVNARESICKNFMVEQFPSLLPIVDALGRAQRVLSLQKQVGNIMFHSLSNNGNNCPHYRYRWVLQTQSDAGGAVTVLDAAEGPSRLGAFVNLLDKLDSSEVVTTAAEASVCVARTIEEYQKALAQQRGVQKIIHEYDRNQHALIVKGIGCSGHSTASVTTIVGTAPSTVVIRVIPLENIGNLGDVVHRYYRMELRLPDLPPTVSAEKLRELSLESIYKQCGKHFSHPLPPLHTALVVEQKQRCWMAILRLPAKIFLLNTPRQIEFFYHGPRKHEGKREVVCRFYRSLHGETTPELRKMLSKAFCAGTASSNTKGDEDGGKNCAIGVAPCRGNGSMYNELLRLIGTRLYSHVGFHGVVECRLSFITGITGLYLRHPPTEEEYVELFHVPIQSASWLPIQLLMQLMSCACQIIPKEELQTTLLGCATDWPSLFLHLTQSERLFCTTFLRRYWGLWVYEEDDVEERATLPGAIYLVERTRRVGDLQFEASLTLVQTPWSPNRARFIKVLASHRSSSAARAELGLWGCVTHQLSQLQQSVEDAPNEVDRAVIAAMLEKGRKIENG